MASKPNPGRTIATFLVLLTLPAAAAAGSGWEKAKSKKGVTIWTRAVDGSKNLDVKGTGIVDAPPSDVRKFLDDPQNAKKLSKSLKEVKVLGSCGENCTYIYERVGQKPIQDRHYVIEMRRAEVGDGGWKFSWKISKKKKPGGSDAIEVKKHNGSWTIMPEDGKTRVKYRNFIDVGGSIPVSFANMGVVDGALKFYLNLREHV